jgi:hypothetical protein
LLRSSNESEVLRARKGGGGLFLSKCQVCSADNLDFAIRCKSCGSILQDSVKALDLFSTIYNIWRFPDSTLRKIVLATHRNYSLLLAALEGIGLSFFALFIVKAADIYSLQFPLLLAAGLVLGLIVFLPTIYAFGALSYATLRIKKTGASLNGFISGLIYAMHPIALGAVVLIPMDVAVFGSYLFSNNPPPQVINPVSFYFLALLDLVSLVAAFVMVLRLTKVLYGVRLLGIGLAALFMGIFSVAVEVAKQILLSR